MMRSRSRAKVSYSRPAMVVFAAFFVWTMWGCDDPKKPETWIKKLRDPEYATEAVRQLKKIGDPVAVKPLCELFRDFPSATILRVIVSFNDKRAIPTLREALDYTDDEKYHNSTMAARALADMKATEAVPDLLKVLEKPIPIKSRANLAKQAAIEALAELGDKRAVPGLIKVADARAEQQDFFLNKVAVKALGQLGDPRAVPVLIRALFMSSTIQGTSFPQANLALVLLGPPAVKPLIAALNGKDDQLNAMAKELEFKPGVIISKTARVLGDLRANDAVPALLALLDRAKEQDGAAEGLEGVIEALGRIGDKRAVSALLRLVQDENAVAQLRIKACRSLTLMSDARAVPVMLELAEKGYLEGGMWDLRVDSVMSYSRMVSGADKKGKAVIQAVLKDEKVATMAAYAPVKRTFEDALARVTLAEKCKKQVACYAETLKLKDAPAVEREKAAIMLGILPDGRAGLDALIAALPIRDPGLRLFMLEAAKRIGKKSDKALVKQLERLVERDAKRSAKFHGADLTRENQIALAIVKRND